MVCCKKLLIIFTIFLLLIGISSFSWCAESVPFDTLSGFALISHNRNYFISGNTSIGYFALEKGYIYFLRNNGGSYRTIALSSDVPSVNGIYQYLTRLEPGDSFEYLASSNDFMYFDFTPGTLVVTRERVGNMDNVVQELANVVSPNQLWNVFNDSIPYILIVVVAGFGFYIIFKLIKKFSKGKSANI